MIRIIQGDALDSLKQLDSESVHCVITSPLIGACETMVWKASWGLEQTPEEYVDNLVRVFREASEY